MMVIGYSKNKSILSKLEIIFHIDGLILDEQQ